MLTTAGGDLHDATWIDLLEPTEVEADSVAAHTGLRVPRVTELSEIETSSRLQRAGDVLTLSVPALGKAARGRAAPVGYVLTKDRLLTIRFAPLASFDVRLAEAARHPDSSVGHFVGLLETVVDHIADLLEEQAIALDGFSAAIFRPAAGSGRQARADQRLRDMLSGIGDTSDLLGRLRDTLLGYSRAVPYVLLNAAEWLPPEAHDRLESLRADIASLSDYDTRLNDKVQFLLDATLGFINIEQNGIIKLLTIVSIVGIPPTFIASLYGMNFKNIAELEWTYGYPLALGLMLVTALAPLVWFRMKGWL